MSEFKIESKHPVPPQNRSVYPFASMNKHDSFYVEGAKEYAKARIAAYSYGRRNNQRYSCRADTAGGRIWRTH